MMKNLIMFVSILMVFGFSALAYSQEEKDLPPEMAPPAKMVQNEIVPSIVFTGYVNSKDVSIIAGVIGAVYNLCAEPVKEFCSDEQGILVVGPENTGKIPEMLKLLDEVIEKGAHVEVRLTQAKFFGGARRIMDVKVLEE